MRAAIIFVLLLAIVGCSQPVTQQRETPVSSPSPQPGLKWVPHKVKVERPIVGGWENLKASHVIIYFRNDGTGYAGKFYHREKVPIRGLGPSAGTSTWNTEEFTYQPHGNAVEIRFENGRERKAVLSEDQQSVEAFGRSFTRIPEPPDDLEFKVP